MSQSHQRFRVALLGAGNIAPTHIAALKRLDGVEIAAVCDLDQTRARALQEKETIPLAFHDLETMLGDARPDVVHILLPPHLHAPAAETCLAAGCHVFIEKPFSPASAECRRVTAAAGRAGRQIGVNHNLVFMPALVRLIDEIHSFRLGAIEHVRVVYNLPIPPPVGVRPNHWMFEDTPNLIFELGIHQLSLICRLLGRVSAASTAVSGETILGNGVRFYRTWMSSLQCERGTAQLLLATGAGFSETSAELIGQDGVARVDFQRNTLLFSESNPSVRYGNLADNYGNAAALLRQGLRNAWATSCGMMGLRPAYSVQVDSVRNILSNFYGALRQGRAPLIGAVEGTAAVEACEIVVDSAMRFVEREGKRT